MSEPVKVDCNDFTYLKKPLKIQLNKNISILLKSIKQKPPYDDKFFDEFFKSFYIIELITAWTMPDELVKEVENYFETTPQINIDYGLKLAKKYIDTLVFQQEKSSRR